MSTRRTETDVQGYPASAQLSGDLVTADIPHQLIDVPEKLAWLIKSENRTV